MPEIPSSSSPAPLLSASTTPSIAQETVQQPATPPAAEASSSHFFGLRRRPNRQGDIESGRPPADDASIGFSSALAPKLQQGLIATYGSKMQHPVTTTGTVLGYQAWNQLSAGGPPGEMPKAPKLPPLEPDRFNFAVPAERGAQLKLATALLDTPGLDKWLPAPIVQSIKVKGHYYAVPVNIHNPTWFWYSKAALQKAGVAGEPKSIDEFFADLDKLKAAGLVPVALGGQT